MGLFFVLIMSFLFLYWIDKRMEVILNQYINVEVERLTNNIVSDAIHKKMKNGKYQNFLIYENEKISYDTSRINDMLENVTKYVQKVLNHLDDGEIDDFFIPGRVKSGRFHHIRNGILCDISLGSIRGSSVFANIGPTIPIRLLFTGQVQASIDVQSKEYGINNVLVEMDFVLKIKEQVSMPISSLQKEIIVREPISIDIIKGEVPNYYGGFSKVS